MRQLESLLWKPWDSYANDSPLPKGPGLQAQGLEGGLPWSGHEMSRYPLTPDSGGLQPYLYKRDLSCGLCLRKDSAIQDDLLFPLEGTGVCVRVCVCVCVCVCEEGFRI